MSTHQSIPNVVLRVRIGRGTALTAVGVLVAIAVAIIVLALTGANQSTAAPHLTASQAAAGSTPQLHYLGPRQEHAAINSHTAGRTTRAAGDGNPALQYTCLGGGGRCLLVR